MCKYDLRKGDLFVLSWARVQRVRQRSLSSELLMCGGGVRSILLLPLVARSSSSRVATSHFCHPLLHTSLRSVIVYQQVISCTSLWQEWAV